MDELVKRLHRYTENCVAYKLDADFASAVQEAADAIENVSKAYQMMAEAYEAEVTNPRWIPVTERLPKEGEFVLVHGNLYPNKHDGGVIAVSKRMDWNYWQGFGRERNITHWMPLPQPPKEE